MFLSPQSFSHYKSIYSFVCMGISPKTSRVVIKEERGEREREMSPAASTRWCPTSEQLMILEEMYRGGIKTPNASQIQQITAHLSLYGKIEGKNVFYWFQNHKARDRQKLRRKLCRQQLHQPIYHQHLLHPFEASTSLGFQPQHHLYTPQFLSQQEGLQDISSNQAMNYTSKANNSQADQMENWMRMYPGDWTMMMDMGTAPSCCNRPLKTLELFPTKSTNLKDECTTSKQHVSCSTTSN